MDDSSIPRLRGQHPCENSVKWMAARAVAHAMSLKLLDFSHWLDKELKHLNLFHGPIPSRTQHMDL